MNIKLLRYLPSVVWMSIIFYLSHQPASESAETSGGILTFLLGIIPISPEYVAVLHTLLRKSAHFMAYLILGLLVYFAYKGNGKVLLILSMSLFLVTSSVESQMDLHSLARKLIHLFAYAILSMLIYFAYQGRRKILFTLTICLLFAISDEIHQLFIPGRSGEVRDVLIDFSGAAFGLVIVTLFTKLTSRRDLDV